MAPKQNRRTSEQRKGKSGNLESKQRGIKNEKSRGKTTEQREVNSEKKSRMTMSWRQMVSFLFILTLAIFCGFLNSYHQYTLFENDRHFSHLSTLEREMTFRTEMGLYYSYFKTIIESSTMHEGFLNIMYNNLTEYPNTINTLKRFNLYPEVILGIAYRLFMLLANYFHFNTKECWMVSRGDNLPSIESCEGLGEPAYFYISGVFIWNGLVGCAIFLYGRILSNSTLGGILSVICFFFNHGESTRVQWTPPLRESFAYPVLLGQMLIVSIILRSNKRNWKYLIMMAGMTIVSILFWQFSQFVLLTQIMAVFGTYMIGFVSSETIQKLLITQMCSLVISYLLMYGNEMLFTSLYASMLIVTFVVTLIEKHLKKLNYLPIIWVSQLVAVLIGSFSMKATISFIFNIRHDDHIWSILKSKFTSYKDFHTLLYTCATEFGFIEKETLLALTKTLLLPSVFVVVIVFTFQIIKKAFKKHKIHILDGAEITYNILQLGAFTVMAVLIMRLKLFFTPHLCLITSLLSSQEFINILPSQGVHSAAVVLLIGLMSVQGIQNIQSQRDILGEYNNPELEQLLEWIIHNTSTEAVFAGPMPTMANLMLSTRRPIVNHPHYEDANLRERTRKVYTLFSRKSAREVHDILSSMGVQYAVIEYRWCFGQTKEGCRMVEIWDVEDSVNREKEPLCEKLLTNPHPFLQVFKNDAYVVLKLKS